MQAKPIHPWRWRLLAVWIIAFSVVVFLSIQSIRNQADEIQQSRVYSCRVTYVSIRQVLLASVGGRQLDPAESERLKGLLRLVDPTKCYAQTKP